MPDNYMQKALEYIDNNITGNISLYDISRAAGFSVPQFYRMFKRLTGDTVSAYILRQRLSLAAKEIKYSRKTISRIAADYGFESHDVFTRAFKRVYGISPRIYRKGEGTAPLKRLVIENSERGSSPDHMEFQVINTYGFELVGMESDALIWDGDGSIGRLWSEFLPRITEIRNLQRPVTMYGVCEHEHCKNNHIKYMAAVGVSKVINIPEGMVHRNIKQQCFFSADVPASISVPDAYSAAIGYAKSLGYEIEEYDNIEVYEEMFRDPALFSFQLLIPVK